MKEHAFVFNGDADGLCALQQLSLVAPHVSRLITGVKRDQALLGRVDPANVASVTVLDLPLPNNRTAVQTLIESGVSVTYFDHHLSGDIPQHPHFIARIDTSADMCTSLIVDRDLCGQVHQWAIVGAFGDNLDAIAIVSETKTFHYSVNVRIPSGSVTSAGAFCGRFASGGGRALAGGINRLPYSELGVFLLEFDRTFGADYQRCKVA